MPISMVIMSDSTVLPVKEIICYVRRQGGFLYGERVVCSPGPTISLVVPTGSASTEMAGDIFTMPFIQENVE